MKHLPIGKLIEKKKSGKSFYRLNLFNGYIIEDFENVSDALELIAYHGEAVLIKHSLLSEIYVKVHHHDGRKHYILMDTNWIDGGKISEVKVYEETEYEFISSHSAFKRLYRRRRFINERKFDFNDILRSSINWSPWFTWIFTILLSLLFMFGASSLVAFFDFVNKAGMEDLSKAQVQAFNLGTWFSITATFIIPLVYFLSFHINKKILKENDFEYGRLNWRKWFVWRMNTHKFCFMIYVTTLYFDVNVVIDMWNLDSLPNNIVGIATFVKFNMLLLSVLISLAILVVSYIIFGMGSAKLIINLFRYLKKDERMFFWRWYFKKTEQMLVKVDYNFFFLDPEETAATAKEEIEESTQLVQKLTSGEIRDYIRKSKHGHKHGVEEYIKILVRETSNIIQDKQ